MNNIFARKIGMTSLFDEKGNKVGVTVLEVLSSEVLQIKTNKSDGYDALVVGFVPLKEKFAKKTQLGLFKKAGVQPVRCIREIRVSDLSSYSVGQKLSLSEFSDAKVVDIIGMSKGRGFAGTIKRHHFRRGRETHGNKNHREPGSVGNHTYPAKVFKGKRMAGQMGAERVTVKNLKVFSVDAERNLFLVNGAVPGPNNATLGIKKVKLGK